MAKIEIYVKDADLTELTRNKRIALLGELAADEAEKLCPAKDLRPGSEFWSGTYDEVSIIEALTYWATLHDGLAPFKTDWSKTGDPDRLWPRASTVCEKVRKIAERRGVHTTWRAPHYDEYWGESCDRYMVHEAVHRLRSHGLAIEEIEVESKVKSCPECFSGIGCVPPDKSAWQFAIEDMAGLTVRHGSDLNSTASQVHKHGRNRQMVTGGSADVYPSTSDPAARDIIETINP